MIGTILMIMLMVIFGFLVVGFLSWLFYHVINVRCKYWKKCPYYNENSNVCCSTGGDYYGFGGKAGCYTQMAGKELK